MKRLIPSLLTILLVALPWASPLGASSQAKCQGTSCPAGTGLFWPAGSTVTYQFNSSYAPGNNSDLVRAAVRQALQTLMNALPKQPNGDAAVKFVEGTATGTVTKSGCDGTNLITFTSTDSGDQLGAGVVAQARYFYSTTATTGNDCGGHPMTVQAGQIFEVDMLFNRTLAFVTNDVDPNKTEFDIQSIGLHEAAHWLGLGHTGITSAVMAPAGESGAFPLRLLHSDDLAGLAAIYGPAGSSISGQVKSSTNAAIVGAHVVATNATTGLTTASAVTDSSGNYKVYGLTSGQSYKVYAEPLDGPVYLGDDLLPEAAAGGTVTAPNFQTAFANSGNPITAGSGDTSGANISLLAGAATVNLQQLGTVTVVGSTVKATYGSNPLTLPRGVKTATLGLGTGISSSSALPATSLPSGNVTIGASALNVFGSSGLVADVTPAANATPGSVDIYQAGSAFPGGLVITPNPVIDTGGLTDSAAYNAAGFAPGSYITVWGYQGKDLAPPGTSVEAGTVVGQPITAGSSVAWSLPTQIAGVSVKVGTLLAPLLYVSPIQINAIIPFELTSAQMAAGVDVAVMVGANSQSTAVHIPSLVASAPRIFMINTTTGVGAIVNYTKSVAQGKTVFADAQSPVDAGDMLVIYCHGLGKAGGSSPAVSGLAYAGAVYADDTSIKVNIGGTVVTPGYAGLVPTLVGLGQINVTVPSGLPSGSTKQLYITSATGQSNTANIWIH
jgi:uncharacterized protein (TIGR03437 family)